MRYDAVNIRVVLRVPVEGFKESKFSPPLSLSHLSVYLSIFMRQNANSLVEANGTRRERKKKKKEKKEKKRKKKRQEGRSSSAWAF